MRMNLEDTYIAMVMKRMLEDELDELETTRESMFSRKIISKATIRKMVKRLFIWFPVFMITVNYVRNGIDLFIFNYTPVFLFYTAIYTAVIVSLIYVYNAIVKKFNNSRNGVIEGRVFYEQNKEALQKNIKTIGGALKNNSSLIPMYRSKVVLEKMIAYKTQGRARTDEEAIHIFEKESPIFSQPSTASKKKRFVKLTSISTKLNRFGRFVGMIFFASMVAKSLNRPRLRRW